MGGGKVFFVCVLCVFFFPPEMSVIVMKTMYADYHRLCLLTSRLCDQKIRKATRWEKPQNILKESFFTNYLCAGFTQNLMDGSSNVWKWINATMQIGRTGFGAYSWQKFKTHIKYSNSLNTCYLYFFLIATYIHKTEYNPSINIKGKITVRLLFLTMHDFPPDLE